MRYPILTRAHCSVELRTFPDSNNEHGNSSKQRQSAEYRRNVNALVFIGGGVDGPDIENIFPMSVRESLIGKCKTTQKNEENSSPKERFHIDRAG